MDKHNTSIELLSSIVKNNLYKLLIAQLNKDFSLVNLDANFSENLAPIPLKEMLQEKIQQLIETDFDSFLNLLYRIDIPESEIKKLNNSTNNYYEEITFILLNRIFKKVWFKSNFS